MTDSDPSPDPDLDLEGFGEAEPAGDRLGVGTGDVLGFENRRLTHLHLSFEHRRCTRTAIALAT